MEVEQFVERAHAAKQAKLTPSPEFTIPRLVSDTVENLSSEQLRYEDTVGTVVAAGNPKAKLAGKEQKSNAFRQAFGF